MYQRIIIMSDNCTEMVGLMSALVVSNAMTVENRAFHCTTPIGNACMIAFSAASFGGLMYTQHNMSPTVRKSLSVVLILAPPVLYSIREMGCDKDPNTTHVLQTTSVLTNMLVPLIIYLISSSEGFRTKMCNHLSKKQSAPETGLMSAKDMNLTSDVDVAEAHAKAKAALERAMAAFKK
jgi:hypothetical protein